MKIHKSSYFLTSFFILAGYLSMAQCLVDEGLNLRKAALVIGVKTYKSQPSLRNTVNDATDMRDSLKRLGFDVYSNFDTDKSTMEKDVENWCRSLSKYDVALFYFSGHGAEYEGQNYLFPSDADPANPFEIKLKCNSANQILERMGSGNVKYSIMILDACRDNPFTKSWGKSIGGNSGLSMMQGSGSFVGFAAAPGEVASEGVSTDRNGLYTRAILDNLMTPNQTISELFTKVNAEVRINSQNKQIPFSTTSLSASFCFYVKYQSLSKRLTTTPINQRAGSMAISDDQQDIYTLDPYLHELVLRDANSFARIRTIATSPAFSTAICNDGKKVYVLDTLKHQLILVNSDTPFKSDSISLPGLPTSLCISNDRKKAYISFKDSLSSNFLAAIDLDLRNILATVKIDFLPVASLISRDDRYVFFSTNTEKRRALFSWDTKKSRIFRYDGTAFGTAMCLSNNGKMLYVSYDSSFLGGINIIELNTFKIIRRMKVAGAACSIDPSGRYLVSISGNRLVVSSAISDSVFRTFPLSSPAIALHIRDDSRIVLWMPVEHRLFLINLPELLVAEKDAFDAAIDQFNEGQRTMSLEPDRNLKIRPTFERIQDTVYNFLKEIAPKLVGDYQAMKIEPQYKPDEIAVSFNGTLLSSIEGRKPVSVPFYVRYTKEGEIHIAYNNSNSFLVFPNSQIDWAAFRTALKNVYGQIFRVVLRGPYG